MRITLVIGLAVLATLVIPACLDSKSVTANLTLDQQLRAIVDELGLTGDPRTGVTIPAITDPLPALGKRLFFTKALSGEFDVACASCHHPMLGGADSLSLGVGVDAVDESLLGPGRVHAVGSVGYDGGPTVPRNAPTSFNTVFFDEVLFWDGRVESLGKTPKVNGDDGNGIRTPDSAFGVADPNSGPNLPTAQARFPVTSDFEMRGHVFEAGNSNDDVRNHLAARLGNYGVGAGEIVEDWLPHFRTGFENPTGLNTELITADNIALALGEYERSQQFVVNPWFLYVTGNNKAISTSAKRGALLFFRTKAQGGFDCASCHSGDLFTDEKFYCIALPQVGRGKGNGGTVSLDTQDLGRFYETGNADDRFAFRTPSLLNVQVTGPYGHAGSYTTLRGIIEHHLSVANAISNYDTNQLDPAIQTGDWVTNTNEALFLLFAHRTNGMPTVEDFAYSDQDVTDLVNFLKTLTDPRVKNPLDMEPWIQRDDGFDSHLLEAYDQGLNPL